jgi:hypothetical protein
MLRFFAGILLAQLAAVLLSAVLLDPFTVENVLIFLFPVSIISVIFMFWFRSIAAQLAEQRIANLSAQFARERENLNLNAERAKTRLVRQTQKEIATETRKARNRANLKVGVAVAVAGGFGMIMLFSQMVTLGLLTLTTAGGAMGGYLARARRDTAALPNQDYKLIESIDDESASTAAESAKPTLVDLKPETGR